MNNLIPLHELKMVVSKDHIPFKLAIFNSTLTGNHCVCMVDCVKSTENKLNLTNDFPTFHCTTVDVAHGYCLGYFDAYERFRIK